MTRNLKIGDTFQDVREGRSGTVRIINIEQTGPCYQLQWSHMSDLELCPYVTEDRLIEITGGRDPVSRVPQEMPDGIDLFEPQALTPADYVTAHVFPKSDGSVVVKYYAWAEVLDKSNGSGFYALRNEASGTFLFEDNDDFAATSVARMIANGAYPYRLSPDTAVDARTFPEKRTFLARLKLQVFGGPSYIASDDLTEVIEAELSRIAQASPPSDTPVKPDWG